MYLEKIVIVGICCIGGYTSTCDFRLYSSSWDLQPRNLCYSVMPHVHSFVCCVGRWLHSASPLFLNVFACMYHILYRIFSLSRWEVKLYNVFSLSRWEVKLYHNVFSLSHWAVKLHHMFSLSHWEVKQYHNVFSLSRWEVKLYDNVFSLSRWEVKLYHI